MSKLKAIRRIILASNYIVITDNTTDASVSPLYAEKFMASIGNVLEKLRLSIYRRNEMYEEIAENELDD